MTEDRASGRSKRAKTGEGGYTSDDPAETTSPFAPSSPSTPYEARHGLHPTRRQARAKDSDGRGDGRYPAGRRRILQGAVEGARRDRGGPRANLARRVSPPLLIQSQPELDALFVRLQGAALLALETLAPLGRVLADSDTEIVFHDADYDLRLLDREYGFHARHVFDTRIAAQLLNEPGVGLAALLEKYLGIHLDKRFQRADWSARPLSPGMLDYAASDTRHLPELRDLLRSALDARGRLDWALEEFALLEDIRWAPGDQEPGYLRLKGAKALKGRELAILREL